MFTCCTHINFQLIQFIVLLVMLTQINTSCHGEKHSIVCIFVCQIWVAHQNFLLLQCSYLNDCKTGLLKTYSAAYWENMVPLKSRFGKMSGASRVQTYRTTHIQLEMIFTQAEPIFLWKSSNLVPWGLEGRNKVGYTTCTGGMYCSFLFCSACSALLFWFHILLCLFSIFLLLHSCLSSPSPSPSLSLFVFLSWHSFPTVHVRTCMYLLDHLPVALWTSFLISFFLGFFSLPSSLFLFTFISHPFLICLLFFAILFFS